MPAPGGALVLKILEAVTLLMEVEPSHETLLLSASGILSTFTLLMSAFSPQLCPDKETLSFNHVLSVPLPSNILYNVGTRSRYTT